jgi:NAD(P)-dependent dehydrogenase (short-subunit alcohol dehydrogenase family)
MVRVALITAASRGIGAVTALLLVKHGCPVVVDHSASTPQSGEEIAATTAAAGSIAVAIKPDVAVSKNVTAMGDEIARRWRETNVLVHRALTRDDVRRSYEHHIGPYFTSDGQIDLKVVNHAVATELGAAAAYVDQMYQSACDR